MFELSVACKYLLPRRRQLSVSIISLISVLVIALVVWLIVVFFSVTDGLEKSWIHKLTALTAPVRIVPTDHYYNSFYYQIDSISDASNYNYKTIYEKNRAPASNPYDPTVDEEIPLSWPEADLEANGTLKDPVKLAYRALEEVRGIPDLKPYDFEITAAQVHLKPFHRSALTHQAYLGNFDPDSPLLDKALLPIQAEDIGNVFHLLGYHHEFSSNAESEESPFLPRDSFQEHLTAFFNGVEISSLKTSSHGWKLPLNLIPQKFEWDAIAIYKGNTFLKILVPIHSKEALALKNQLEKNPNYTLNIGKLKRDGSRYDFDNIEIDERKIPIYLPEGISIPAAVERDSLAKAARTEDIRFKIDFAIQHSPIQGVVPFRGLSVGRAKVLSSNSDFWIYKTQSGEYVLPADLHMGEGILLPKGFKETGVRLGDRGYLTYFAATASTLQDQRLPIYVAGFYDPGIIPIGGKFILANRDVITTIKSAHNPEDQRHAANGINVRFKDYKLADQVKERLLNAFEKYGIAQYWKVETFREFDFTREIIRELQSQKNIFSVIAVVIILVACSNIISMLIILVNDKKVEIGILRSMGATSKSIALIFGLSGAFIGVLGSLIGIGAAIFTIRHLQLLVDLISKIQGYDLFNAAFYGEAIPQELSYEALSFVLVATVLISLLAGIVPAVKACLLKPTDILRSNG